MSLSRFIAQCNRHEPAAYLPFLVGGRPVGHVRRDRANRWRDQPRLDVTEEAVALKAEAEEFSARTAALAALTDALSRAGEIPWPRGEAFAVVENFGDAPLAAIDRGAVPLFGTRSFGVHLNGFVGAGDDLALWIGKRAADKPVAPGKLDNMVAGGQPIGLTLMENLAKECAEEAAIPEALARQAKPVGAITYVMELNDGLRVDTLFCFDLAVPKDFTPRNIDGELESFALWPVAEVLDRMRRTDDFKFNVNLVLIDFFIRHGVLTPDEPDYLGLVAGLRR